MQRYHRCWGGFCTYLMYRAFWHTGSKEHKGTVQRMVQPGGIGHASTSDTIKGKSKRPCLVVRPAVSLLLTATVKPD